MIKKKVKRKCDMCDSSMKFDEDEDHFDYCLECKEWRYFIDVNRN